MESLESVPTERLVVRYAEAAKRRGAARAVGNVAEANDQSAEAWEISGELRRRDAQRVLLDLLQDDDPSVRFFAGTDALSFAPERGERVLTELMGLSDHIALDAEMMLELWREGRLPSP